MHPSLFNTFKYFLLYIRSCFVLFVFEYYIFVILLLYFFIYIFFIKMYVILDTIKNNDNELHYFLPMFEQLPLGLSINTDIEQNYHISIVKSNIVENVAKTAYYVGKNLDNIETVNFSKIPKVHYYYTDKNYKLLMLANKLNCYNIVKVLNPHDLELSNFKRVNDVANHFKNSNISSSIVNNTWSYNICSRAVFNCEYINKNEPFLVNSLPSHIYRGLKDHPLIHYVVNNKYSRVCVITHYSPYIDSKLLGIDLHTGKEMYASPFWLELETAFFNKIKSNATNPTANLLIKYQTEIETHMLDIVNNIIDINKIYICNTRLPITIDKLSDIYDLDVDYYIKMSDIFLDNKTKLEIDHIKEIIYTKK